MASASNPADYSSLQAVDGRYPDSEGLQPMNSAERPEYSDLQPVPPHLIRDENGTDVVVRGDPENDAEKLEMRRKVSKKKRRVCGLPIMVVVGLVTLLVIGAIVGGVVGGVVGKKKDDDPAATPSDPNAVPFANATTEIPPAATQTGFAFPELNKWYRIFNENADLGGVKRALRARNNDDIRVYEPVVEEYQYWQFIATDGQRGNRGGTYWISNQYWSVYYLSALNNKTAVGVYNRNISEPLQRWYFVQGSSKNASHWLLKNQALGKGWNLGYDVENLSRGKMKNKEGIDTYWYVEEANPKSDTRYPNTSSTSSMTTSPTRTMTPSPTTSTTPSLTSVLSTTETVSTAVSP